MAKNIQTPNTMEALKSQVVDLTTQADINSSDSEKKDTTVKANISWRDKIKTEIAPLIEFQCILPGSGQIIAYKSMNTRDLKTLLLYQGVTDPLLLEDILDKLITSVVTTPDFNIDNIYTYDKAFLIIQIRINSKGGLIESTYECPKCGQMVLFSQNLSTMKLISKPTNIQSEIKVSPNFSVFLDYNTRGEQKEIHKFATAKKDMDRITELGLFNLASLIKAIKIDNEMITGDITPQDKINIFMDLPESAFDKIVEWDKKNGFGIDMKYKRTCPHCKNIDEIEIPASAIF